MTRCAHVTPIPAAAYLVVLVALVPVLHHACADGAPAGLPSVAPAGDHLQPVRVGPDFGQFWFSALGVLELAPPDCYHSGARELRFRGLHGTMRKAWWDTGGPAPVGVVIHITDADQATAVPGVPGFAQAVFAWREGVETEPLLTDARNHPLYRAVLDTCRLAQLASGALTERPPILGLVGEGYGAGVALAVAALLPDRVHFVVAHQPISLGLDTAGQPLHGPTDAPAPAQFRTALTRLSAASFAPWVAARTLITLGTEDTDAPPASVLRLYHTLPGEKTLWALEGMAHCPAVEVPDWHAAWQTWAMAYGPPS